MGLRDPATRHGGPLWRDRCRVGPERAIPRHCRQCLDTYGILIPETQALLFGAHSCSPLLQIENGYAIWDFRGQEIEKRLLDRFKQFLWRPRPQSLLTKEQKRTIRRNLREYSRAFEEADAAEETTVSAELVAQRKRAVDEWNAWRVRVAEEVAEVRRAHGKRDELPAQKQEEEDKEEIEVWIDEVIEQIEEVVVEAA
jgi:uncharacterized protein with WD repeat